MTPSTATITRTRDFDHPVEAIFAHWTSPETRLRWETGPDTGMKYDEFDTRDGGVEVVRIIKDGTEVGHMVQSHLKFVENEMIATSVIGVFGGETTTIMSVVIEFSPKGDGCTLEAVSQVCDLKGGDVQAQHERGWDWILGRFEDDIAEHGVVTG